MKFLVCLLVLLVVSNAFAQTKLKGRVIERPTGEAVIGATVTLITDSNQRVKQITNARGAFAFARSDAAKILVHALGYFDATVPVSGQPDSITIYLDPNPKDEQVVVTALRHASAEQQVPVSTVVTRNSEIQSHNPQGLDNALRYIPGVTLSEDQVSIRGSSGYSRSVGARVLLLLDGMPFLAADNGDMKFDAIPLLDVERVEVVKGAGSALYGSSALGGVINVITRTPTAAPHFAINAYSGFYDEPSYEAWKVPSLKRRFVNVEAGTTGSFSTIGYLVSGAYKRNEGYRLGDDNFRYNGFGKLEIPINSSNRITLTGLAANEDHGGWLYWRGLNQPLMPEDSVAAINARIHSFKTNLYADWQSFVGDNISTTLKINNFHTSFTTDPAHPHDTSGAHSSANNLTADASATWVINRPITLTAGLSTSLQSVTSDLFQNHNGLVGGAFAQLEYNVGSLLLTPGIRYDIITYDGNSSQSQFSPKVGMAYQLIPELSLRASYGSGFRAPSIAERFIQSTLAGFRVHPNLDLKPERSNSFEVGGTLQLDELSVDAAGFYSKLADLIEPNFVSDNTSGSAFIQFRNVTQARIAGHEENVTFRPFDGNVELRAGYTYIYPENTETHQILQFRSRHVMQLGGTAKLAPFIVGSDFRYVSAYETMDSLLSVQIPDGSARVDAKVLDVRLGCDLKFAGLPILLTFQVQNVLNYYYVEIAGNLAPLRNYSLRLESNF